MATAVGGLIHGTAMYHRSPVRRVSRRGIQQRIDRAGEGGTPTALVLPDPLTTRGEAVIAALATVLWSLPVAGHQALLLQMTKNGINRAILPVGGAFEFRYPAFPDTVAVARPSCSCPLRFWYDT